MSGESSGEGFLEHKPHNITLLLQTLRGSSVPPGPPPQALGYLGTYVAFATSPSTFPLTHAYQGSQSQFPLGPVVKNLHAMQGMSV